MPFSSPASPPCSFSNRSTLPLSSTPITPRRRHPLQSGPSSTRPLDLGPSTRQIIHSADSQIASRTYSTPPSLAARATARKKRSVPPRTPSRASKRARRFNPPSPSPAASSAQALSPRSPVESTFNFSPVLFPAPARPPLQRPTTDMSFLNPIQPNHLCAKVDLSFENDGCVEMMGGPHTS
jgi:hypothetical protein